MSPSTAAGAAEALAEALFGSNHATKSDIMVLRHEMELLRRDLMSRLGSMMVVGWAYCWRRCGSCRRIRNVSRSPGTPASG